MHLLSISKTVWKLISSDNNRIGQANMSAAIYCDNFQERGRICISSYFLLHIQISSMMHERSSVMSSQRASSQNDEYEKYLYASVAPRVTIEIFSDNESSRRPSQVSPSMSTSSSFSHLPRLDCPGPPPSYIPHMVGSPCMLGLPGVRGMATSASADDLFRMRNFSTSGKRIINKGDSILSRSNLSINHLGSR